MLQSAVRSDQRIAIYWPKSYLLVLFIINIIVKAGVIPTKTDWNAMNLTRRYRCNRERKKERKKERRVTEEEKEERTNPKFCQWCRSFIRRFKLEIVLSQLPCRHPYNHFTVGRLNQKQQNRTESVCAEPLFVIPACEPNICAKNSSISCLWLVEIGDRMGPVDGSISANQSFTHNLWSIVPVVTLQTAVSLSGNKQVCSADNKNLMSSSMNKNCVKKLKIF